MNHRPELNYRIVETGGEGGINGGIVKPDKPGPWPGNMLFYILVDDLAKYRKQIVGQGEMMLLTPCCQQGWPIMRAL